MVCINMEILPYGIIYQGLNILYFQKNYFFYLYFIIAK